MLLLAAVSTLYPPLWFIAAGISVFMGTGSDTLLASPLLVRTLFISFWLAPAANLIGLLWSLLSPPGSQQRTQARIFGAGVLFWLAIFALLGLMRT